MLSKPGRFAVVLVVIKSDNFCTHYIPDDWFTIMKDSTPQMKVEELLVLSVSHKNINHNHTAIGCHMHT